jgi:hypothetical protein
MNHTCVNCKKEINIQDPNQKVRLIQFNCKHYSHTLTLCVDIECIDDFNQQTQNGILSCQMCFDELEETPLTEFYGDDESIFSHRLNMKLLNLKETVHPSTAISFGNDPVSPVQSEHFDGDDDPILKQIKENRGSINQTENTIEATKEEEEETDQDLIDMMCFEEMPTQEEIEAITNKSINSKMNTVYIF